jgi:hypothetical protein
LSFFQHLLCVRPMLGIWSNLLQPPHSCNMGLPIPPSQFTEEETESQGDESSASGHTAESRRTGIGLGCLTSSSDAANAAVPSELEGKNLSSLLLQVYTTPCQITAYLPPSLHNVTITVAEGIGPCRIMSFMLPWDASFPLGCQGQQWKDLGGPGQAFGSIGGK